MSPAELCDMAVFSGSIGCDHMDVPECGFSFTCWLQSIHTTPTCCCARRVSWPQLLTWFLRKFKCALSHSFSFLFCAMWCNQSAAVGLREREEGTPESIIVVLLCSHHHPPPSYVAEPLIWPGLTLT